MNPRSETAALITQYSNNQNGVKARDFKSNNASQIRLQNEFRHHYDGQFYFEIKTGDNPGLGDLISNEAAGLELMAFDLKEPWATHRKYEVFEDKYADLFGRPEVTADRIVMCRTIMRGILDKLDMIENKMFARYALTRYFLMFVVRELLETDEVGRMVITGPQAFVRKPERRKTFGECVSNLVTDTVSDLNEEVKGLGEDFDYRDKLRDSVWVQAMTGSIKKDYLKLVNRGRIPSFKKDWEERNAKR